jgi:hypothetical protein
VIARVLRFLSVLAAPAVAALLACNDTNVCGQREEPVLRHDGTEYRCTLPDDCPRPASALLCVTDAVLTKECVRCRDTRCMRSIPELCQ